MNVHEYYENKKRRNNETEIVQKLNLSLPNAKQSRKNIKYNVFSRKKIKSSKNINSKYIETNLNNNYHYNNKKLSKKHISIIPTKSLNQNFGSNIYRKSLDKNENNLEHKRHSFELFQTQATKKFYLKYNLKLNIDNNKKKKIYQIFVTYRIMN